MTPYNVLVFPGGSEIGLEINRALCHCKEVILFSGAIEGSHHAPFVYKNNIALPSIYENGWLEILNQAIQKNRIDFIFPAYDDIVVELAKYSNQLAAKVITSPYETCYIARSKLRTYREFADVLPVPICYSTLNDVTAYPIFIKPDIGQGSQGAQLVHYKSELETLHKQFLDRNKILVMMENLTGTEYTIDCFSHRTQGLLYCSGRERIRTKNGISVASRPVEKQIFREYAQIISKRLVMHGAWFFQVKQDREGIYKLLEIAPRIAGTMALNRVQGVNFPLLSIYEALAIPLHLIVNHHHVEIDRALTNRYKHDLVFDTVYVDLDDTLIIRNKVNLELVRFLYQCINLQLKLILVTRHQGDLTQTLSQYRLQGLFDQIIHLTHNEKKSDYIDSSKAIFIDDSFNERQDVNLNCQIPTFDVSMIEMLLDDRM